MKRLCKPIICVVTALVGLLPSACMPEQVGVDSSPSSLAIEISQNSVLNPLSGQPTNALQQISYGESFGMCRGYCHKSLTVTKKQMILLEKAVRKPEEFPERVIAKKTPPDIWNKLLKLVNFEKFEALPKVIDCPDCADGGSEWIELWHASGKKLVTFPHSGGLPQHEELLAELKRIFKELKPVK